MKGKNKEEKVAKNLGLILVLFLQALDSLKIIVFWQPIKKTKCTINASRGSIWTTGLAPRSA